MQNNFIYLDNNATTPLDPRVLEAMMPYLTTVYGNASSSHRMGKNIKGAIDQARRHVGDMIDANPEDIYFTSGATEAINIALQGLSAKDGKPKHIITAATEHPAVLDTCKYLETIGVEVTYLPVSNVGEVSFDDYHEAFKENTVLACFMTVNNETGFIQDIGYLAAIAHRKGALFMTDATQAIGKIRFRVTDFDIVAMSAHKFYGPKGIGALYVSPHIKLRALVYGGGHERGLRSGTLAVANIIGMGKAAALVTEELELYIEHSLRLHAMLQTMLMKTIPSANPTLGILAPCAPGTLNMRFEGINNDALVLGLRDICISNGSACHSFVMEPSHVLLAMGMTKEEANECVRFSLGRFNTEDEIIKTVEVVKETVERLRASAV